MQRSRVQLPSAPLSGPLKLSVWPVFFLRPQVSPLKSLTLLARLPTMNWPAVLLPAKEFQPMLRPSSRLIAAALVLACSGLGGLPRTAVAQPSLTHLTPGAIAPGKTTEVTLHG